MRRSGENWSPSQRVDSGFRRNDGKNQNDGKIRMTGKSNHLIGNATAGWGRVADAGRLETDPAPADYGPGTGASGYARGWAGCGQGPGQVLSGLVLPRHGVRRPGWARSVLSGLSPQNKRRGVTDGCGGAPAIPGTLLRHPGTGRTRRNLRPQADAP